MIDATALAVAGSALFLTYAIQWAAILVSPRKVTNIQLQLRIQANICRWGGAALLVASVVTAVTQQ